MKKISQVIMIVLGMMVVLTGKVWAQDGSLKINVDVPVQTNVNEQTYFEQDITLKQLFDASLSQMISQQQAEESLSETQDKALLFLSTDSQKLNPIETDQFFLTQSATTPNKGVKLRPEEKTSPFNNSWIHCIRIINEWDIDLSIFEEKENTSCIICILI